MVISHVLYVEPCAWHWGTTVGMVQSCPLVVQHKLTLYVIETSLEFIIRSWMPLVEWEGKENGHVQVHA